MSEIGQTMRGDKTERIFEKKHNVKEDGLLKYWNLDIRICQGLWERTMRCASSVT